MLLQARGHKLTTEGFVVTSSVELKMTNSGNFTRVDQVAGWRLCTGCGACVPACGNQAIILADVRERGLRPVVNPAVCQKCGGCVDVCPGIEISHKPSTVQVLPELMESWGPVIEIWEGYASDPEIRFRGSSGGVATALALFCLEKQAASGVLHTGTRQGAPLESAAFFSRCKADLLQRTGSRYSPAAPCEKLQWIVEASGTSVFVGKPCDVVALRKSQTINPELAEKTGLAISIFCAGTPAMAGTYNILDVLGVKPDEVEEFRYRGCGWPGATSAKTNRDGGQTLQMTYEQAWGDILSNYAQFRCRLCPDSTGEFADISCGDPWYRDVEPGEDGWSLVLVRTERGRQVLRKAIAAGYVKVEQVRSSTLPESQKALLMRRRHLWGRLLVMRAMRIPGPRYAGFYLFRNWLRLSVWDKLRSLGGTLRRITARGWRKPLELLIADNETEELTGVKQSVVSLEEVET